ncbi:LLM class flavin-dependent oxidoreductase [Streptomyces sp. NPDC008137]|uniref:LLM class flavin-dependent oxidoreductase n=1 Tax=Streptomyces sp. NPDC008137 TaxID=3364813 RepID=UPI0036E3FA97
MILRSSGEPGPRVAERRRRTRLPASVSGTGPHVVRDLAREEGAGDYAHDGEIWRFPTSTSVPKPVQRPHPPVWIAARDPASHDFAVAQGCNVTVTPLMKGDEEVVALKATFDTAAAGHPEVLRPDLMVLRHTHVHSPDEPDGWRPAAEAINRFYRTFDAWFGQRDHSAERVPAAQPGVEVRGPAGVPAGVTAQDRDDRHPGRVVERLRAYEELGVDEYSFWIDTGLPHEEKRKSLELFIKEVMPAFQ